LELIARVKRTVGAAGIALLVLAGVMAASPQHSYAATPVVAGGTAIVTNTDGDNIRVRAGASTQYERVGSVQEGDIVSVLDGPAKDSVGIAWFKVSTSSLTGWVMSEFLDGKDAPASAPPPAQPQAPAAPKLEGFARVANAGGDPVRLRTSPSRAGDVITMFYEGTSVAIKAGPQADADGLDWYQVSANGHTGWMMAQYLVQADAPPAEAPQAEPAARTEAPASAPPAEPAASTSSLGQEAVNVAMKYLGYRYRYGGTSPSGFDCSGYVYYVYHKTLGIPVTRDMYTQTNSGTRISRANLQPGDMVFFQNTYKRGLSHAGIYIGNGKFIHAENESTGVVISSLSTSYWSTRWYGATRPSR
jgi:peptidoglycan endopeptidase LytF